MPPKEAAMRKVTLGLAGSLNNYIVRKDGGSDWLYWDDEIAKLSAKFMKTVDAILIVRETYEVMLIDEVVLNIHPVLLGSGIPLFHEMQRQIELELLDSQANKRGNLIVSYRVKH